MFTGKTNDNMKAILTFLTVVFISCKIIIAQTSFADSVFATIDIYIPEDTFLIKDFKDSSYVCIINKNEFHLVKINKQTSASEKVDFHLIEKDNFLQDGINMETHERGELKTVFYLSSGYIDGWKYYFRTPNSGLSSYSFYSAGKNDGLEVVFRAGKKNGFLWIKNYENGMLHGYQYQFFRKKNNSLTSLAYFEYGIQQEYEYHFNRAGNIISEVLYFSDICVYTKYYYNSGKLKTKGIYNNAGDIVKTEFYKRNGKIKNIKQWQ